MSQKCKGCPFCGGPADEYMKYLAEAVELLRDAISYIPPSHMTENIIKRSNALIHGDKPEVNHE